MAKKKKNKTRIFLVLFLCLVINALVFYHVGGILKQVYFKKQEEKELKEKYTVLLDEEEKLQAEAKRLQDPSYVAKYAREKFLYSKDNEYVVRIKDEE